MRSSIAGRELQQETWILVSDLRTESGLEENFGSLVDVERMNLARLAKREAQLPPVLLASGVVLVSARRGRRPTVAVELFPDAAFGELIFLVKEGILIVPSDMGERPIRAMHGYHPSEPQSYAALLTNQPSLPEDVVSQGKVCASPWPGKPAARSSAETGPNPSTQTKCPSELPNWLRPVSRA